MQTHPKPRSDAFLDRFLSSSASVTRHDPARLGRRLELFQLSNIGLLAFQVCTAAQSQRFDG
jgi:hypothetical protein